MDFRGDERAVTVQIGAVLLLGFLVVTLSLYQATVVPDQNRQVEFQHNQRVQADMQQVRNAILGTAATGSSAPVAVELGTRYPSRTVAVNPAPPSGTLSTAELGEIEIRNATARGVELPGYDETADFWDGDRTPTYDTTALIYQPSYANYDAPTTVYENGVVYNRFGERNVTRSGQSIVAGTQLSLVALDGELARSSSNTVVVDPRAVSVSTRTISVSNASASEPVSIVVPTRLTSDEWEALLSQTGELSGSGGYVSGVEPHPDGVELVFETGVSYQLTLSKVGVGTNVSDTERAYLTSADDLIEYPFADRTYPFEVESRDKFNNPIGAQVRANVPPGVVVEPGRYRYQYTAPAVTEPTRDWVNVTYSNADLDSAGFDGSLPENVQYDVTVQASGGGGGTGGGGGGGDSGAAAQVVFGGDGTVEGSNNGRFRFGVENTGQTGVDLARFAVGGPLAETLSRSGNNPEFRLNNAEAETGGSYTVDGTFYDVTLTDGNPTLQSTGAGDVRLEFLRSGGSTVDTRNLQYAPNSAPADAQLYVVLEFEDGTQKTFSFE